MATNPRFFHKQSSYHKKNNNLFTFDQNFTPQSVFQPNRHPSVNKRYALNELSVNISSYQNQERKPIQRYYNSSCNEEPKNSFSQYEQSKDQFSRSGLFSPHALVVRPIRQGSLRQRPMSSGSQINGRNTVIMKKRSLVLNRECQQGQQRISASRSLAKYCKVQRNKSYQRFKVKVVKDKGLAATFLSTRKITFAVKGKKQQSQTFERTKKQYQKVRLLRKGIKQQGQDYQVRGWDFQ